MKIEWTLEHFLSDTSNETKSAIPVARLAEVNALLKEAVWAMYELAVERRSSLADLFDLDTDSQEFIEKLACDKSYRRAHAFLASEVVTEWRERQEKESI